MSFIPSETKINFVFSPYFFYFWLFFPASLSSYENQSFCPVPAKFSIPNILIFYGYEISRLYTVERVLFCFFFISFNVLLFLTPKKRQSTSSSLCYMFLTSFISAMTPLQLRTVIILLSLPTTWKSPFIFNHLCSVSGLLL